MRRAKTLDHARGDPVARDRRGGVARDGAGRPGAIVIGGGGSSRTDCLLVLDAPVNDPPAKPKQVRCTDGDPSCDADGVVNGVCVFAVGVCANSTFDPRTARSAACSSITVEHALDNGDPKFDPDFQALQTRIDSEIESADHARPTAAPTPTNIRVSDSRARFRGNVCSRRKKQVKIATAVDVPGGRSTTRTRTS